MCVTRGLLRALMHVFMTLPTSVRHFLAKNYARRSLGNTKILHFQVVTVKQVVLSAYVCNVRDEGFLLSPHTCLYDNFYQS